LQNSKTDDKPVRSVVAEVLMSIINSGKSTYTTEEFDKLIKDTENNIDKV